MRQTVSDVQLDTGIGVGKAQVLPNLDTQGLFNAKLRRDELEAAKAAKKAKEDEDKLKYLREKLTPLNGFEKLNRDAKQRASQIFDKAGRNPNDPTIPDDTYAYSAMSKANKDLFDLYNKKKAEISAAKQKGAMVEGENEFSDTLKASESLPYEEFIQVIGDAINGMKAVDREDAVASIERSAKALGDEINEARIKNGDFQTGKNLSAEFQDKAQKQADYLASSSHVWKNGRDQIVYDAKQNRLPIPSEEEMIDNQKAQFMADLDKSLTITPPAKSNNINIGLGGDKNGVIGVGESNPSTTYYNKYGVLKTGKTQFTKGVTFKPVDVLSDMPEGAIDEKSNEPIKPTGAVKYQTGETKIGMVYKKGAKSEDGKVDLSGRLYVTEESDGNKRDPIAAIKEGQPIEAVVLMKGREIDANGNIKRSFYAPAKNVQNSVIGLTESQPDQKALMAEFSKQQSEAERINKEYKKAAPKKETKSKYTTNQQAALDAFKNQLKREPTASELDKILKKYK